MSGPTWTLPEWVATPRWNSCVGPGSVAVLMGALVGCWWLAGFVGAVVWVCVVTTWFLFPVIVSVAVAQFGLLVMLPDNPTVTTILLAEVPVVLLLIADLVEQLQAWVAGAVLLGLAAVSIGAVLGLGDDVLIPMAIGVIAIGVLASYLLHRYLLVTLGLVESGEHSA